MKECGNKTRDTAREHTGNTLEVNSRESTQEIGLKMKGTEEELFLVLTEIDTTGSGRWENPKEKDE